MVDYGITRSAVKPEEKVVDEYSVWVNTDITETAGGWEYHMVHTWCSIPRTSTSR